MKLLLATTNLGKITELQQVLQSTTYTITNLSDLSTFTEVAETGHTFKLNAVKKAKGYGRQSGLLTLADDSGLEVAALNGRPGVWSKRYGSTDSERNQKLLTELKTIPQSKRNARFFCVMALYDPRDDRVYTTTGTTTGYITLEPQGTAGFGFDPVFYSDELQKTFAQATRDEKNCVSHRGRAMEEMVTLLSQMV